METPLPVKRPKAKRANGQGSVFYSESMNRYVAKVTVAKGSRKSFYGPPGDRTAKARVGVEERMLPFMGRRLADGTAILGPMISDFITHHTELAPATIAIYKTASKHIVGNPEKGKPADPIARKKLLDLEPTDIKAFYERLVTGDTMKSKVHILLHRVLEEAVDLELIHRNPASRVPKPQVPYQEMAVWKPAEMRRFIKAAQGHRLYALFLLSICSTMGPAELFGLQRRDLSLDKHYLVVNRNLVTVEGRVHEKETKVGKRRRRIKLPKIVVRALRERLRIAEAEGHAGSPYVFTSDKGYPLRGDNFRNRIWKPLLEKAKVPIVKPYAMRHSANALMGHLGVPIEVAQARMGHTSIKTTVDVYGHLFDASGEAVADKLDVFFKGLK